DAVFAVDLVGGRQQLAWRLLAQNIHAPCAIRQMKRGVALSAFELKDAQRRAETFDAGFHVADKARFIEEVRFADGRQIGGQISHWRGSTVSYVGHDGLAISCEFFEG